MLHHYANVDFRNKRIEEKRIRGEAREQRNIKKKGENDRKDRET